MIPEVREKEYEERLKILGLPSLVYRRRRGDLIEVYKYKHEIYSNKHGNSEKLLPPKTYEATRGNSHKIEKQTARLEIRRNFFSLRVHDAWNALPEDIVNAPSLDAFKRRLDRISKDLMYSTEYPLPAAKKVDQGTHTESDEDEEPDATEPE